MSEGPSKSVRIEASTLNQIFEEKDYNLSFVRKNKIVKPFEVGMLPNEIKMMESSKQRKDLFIKIVLPLILSENNRIKRDRNTLFKILNRSNNTKTEKDWLDKWGYVYKSINIVKSSIDKVEFIKNTQCDLFIDDFSKGQEYGDSYKVLYTDTITQLRNMGINLEIFKGDWNEIRSKYVT